MGRRAFLFVTGLLVGLATVPATGEPLAVSNAEIGLELNRHLLEDLGLRLVLRAPTGELAGLARSLYPARLPVHLRIEAPGGSFERLAGGSIRATRGFDLLWNDGALSLEEFELAPASPPALFELRAADGEVALFLDSPHPQFLPTLDQFVFLNMDLRLSEAFARRLGRREAAGVSVGSADVRLQLAEPPGSLARSASCGAVGEDLFVDVELSGISSVLEAYHDSQRVALAPAVDLINVGTADVEWYRPIYPDGGGNPAVVGPHPFLAINLYRLAGGVMHQIGRADTKHAFFAANSGCDCPGAQILYVGCSDLYGAQTNYSRTNLAPRDEVSAFTGSWQSLGSHFDGQPANDERDHHGEGDHGDPFEHRLTATAADLSVAGAQYFIEAWYVTPGDVNIFNSMGRRAVAPQQGAPWTFPFTDSGVTQGPAIDEWVDPSAPPAGAAVELLDTGEGRVELISSSMALAGGLYRYDYGLMNFDFDRRLRSLALPLPPGVEVADVTFHDGDGDPGNDWQAAVNATEIVWSTPAGDPSLGALDWGTLFNFGFVANASPDGPTAVMGVLEAGAPAQLTAAGRGPGPATVPVSRLDVAAAGGGFGSVTSAPAGIDCGSDCDELYAPDTPVQLAASAVTGSALIRWTEDGVAVGNGDTLEAVLDSDRSLVAVFELCDRRLEAQLVSGVALFEACEVLSAGGGFEVTATGDATLRAGSEVALTDDFSVAAGGELAIEIDLELLP